MKNKGTRNSMPKSWKKHEKKKEEKRNKKQANKLKDRLTAYKLIGTFVIGGGMIFSVAIMISSRTSASIGKKKECTSSVTIVEVGIGSSKRDLASEDVDSSIKSKKNLNEIILNLTEKLPGMNLDVEVAARSLRALTAAHRNINSKEN